MTRRAHGFTLIELMVVVALTAIVIGLVGPSMRELLAVKRVQSINAEMMTDLQYARTEAVRRNQSVVVQFQSNGTMTCYVVTAISAAVGKCNCLETPGSACKAGWEEIKTVQIPRTADVTLAASSSMSTLVRFEKLAGTSLPGDFQVDVVSSLRGQLRTGINPAGLPSVCSPDGSVTQVPKCGN